MSKKIRSAGISFSLNKYFCPMCHFATLYEHEQSSLAIDYNKCRSCGYMELKCKTVKRLEDFLDKMNERKGNKEE
jgi:ferredoxin-like protein FixX